jgi:hypothetical protein
MMSMKAVLAVEQTAVWQRPAGTPRRVVRIAIALLVLGAALYAAGAPRSIDAIVGGDETAGVTVESLRVDVGPNLDMRRFIEASEL